MVDESSQTPLRRTMVRRRFLALSATGLATLAAACSPAATQPPAQTGAKVTLNVWEHFTGKLEEVFRTMCADFSKQAPDVAVQVTSVPAAEIWPKVLASVAAGAPPDTYTSAALTRPELIRDKGIDPLDKYGKRPDDAYKSFDGQTVYDGAWYGVPMNGGLCANYYNEDLYVKVGLDPAKPPTTWDDLVTHSKKLTDAAQNQFGIVLANKPISWTVWVWYSYLLSAGGEFLTTDRSQAAFNSDAGLQTLQLWVDLVNTHKVAPTGSLDNNGVMAAYQTGKVGIMPNYPVLISTVVAYPFKSRTVTVPVKARQGSHLAGSYMSMMSGGKNKDALWRFFQWWMTPEVNARWCAETGGLPIRKSATDHPIYQDFAKQQPMTKAFLDSMDFAKTMPLVMGVSEMEQLVSEAIEAAVFLKAKPKDALDGAAQKVNDVIKKNKT
jgi:ABC-type glycerol-3-phosphate transport system substrate-binding protein